MAHAPHERARHAIECAHAMPQLAMPQFFVRNVRVFDGVSSLPSRDVSIADGAIAAITPHDAAARPASGFECIDGEGLTLLPGLIDAHTHIFSAADLRASLLFGITTELDMANDHILVAPLRGDGPADASALRAGLRSAGTLITSPDGHGTENTHSVPTIWRPADAAALVDRCIHEGSDYIKIICEDGSAYGFTLPTLDLATMTAVARAAHDRGKLAVAHISSLHGAHEAMAAGVDGLAHLFVSEPPDAEFAAQAAARGVFVTPTLTVLEATCGMRTGLPLLDDERITPYLTSGMRDCLEMTCITYPRQKSLRMAYAEQAIRALRDAGVPLLAGTDVSNPGTAHGASLHRELELLVHAGLTPTEALAAATSAPARAFGLVDRGRIESGLRADLLLVRGDPTTDITATRDIVGVWKNGVPLARDAAAARLREEEDAGPVGAADGIVSDFDRGPLATRFGAGWMPVADGAMGGRSRADVRLVDAHDEPGKRCLLVHGVIDPALPAPWAGAMFCPGQGPFAPANLSSKRCVRFRARDEHAGTFAISLHFWRHSMHRRSRPFETGPEWRQYDFPLAQFQADGRGVLGLLFLAGPASGPFSLQLDDVRFD
jgi:imidazolonepropionase-like amidohydrolase